MTERHARVLVVDDDVASGEMLEFLLKRDGHLVDTARSVRGMHHALAVAAYDLILLDVRLPDGNGVEELRGLRIDSDVPIIMVSGQDTTIDRVLGLESGADDYVVKPFEGRELLARVHSVLRRSRAGRRTVRRPAVLRFDEWVMDLGRRELTRLDGERVALTSAEFDLLRALIEQPHRPLSRDDLMAATKSREWSPFDRSIDVLIGRIRKKIEADPADPLLIKTVRSVGYVLAANVVPFVGSKSSLDSHAA
ncbi:MAG: winged helix-turn-helix domain-containing protein [Alphaproteobacteria bacterium]